MSEDANRSVNDLGTSVDVSGATETRASVAEPKVEPELVPSATGAAAAPSAKSTAWAATLLGMPGGTIDPPAPRMPSDRAAFQPTVPTDVRGAAAKADESSSTEGSPEATRSRPPVVFHGASDDDDELGPAIGEPILSRAFARSLSLGMAGALVMGLAVVGLIRIGPQDGLEIQPAMTSTPEAPGATTPGSPTAGAVAGSSEAVAPPGGTAAERGLTAGAPPEGLPPAAVTGDSPAGEPWPVPDDSTDQRANDGRMADKRVRAVGASGPTSLDDSTVASSKAPLSPIASPIASIRNVARTPQDRMGDPKMDRAPGAQSLLPPEATLDARFSAPADGRLSGVRKPGELPVGGAPSRIVPARVPDPALTGRRDIVPAGGPTQPTLSVRPVPTGPSPRPATSLSEDPDAPLPLTEP